MALLAVTGCAAVTQNAGDSYLKPWNDVRAYASDLVWVDGLPEAIFDALPDDDKFKTDDGVLLSYFSSIASIDLDGDLKDELIVHSSQFFSGGPEFVIFQKRGNDWQIIANFQGGFTISKQTTNGYAELETWSRHPEIYHHVWKFSGATYKRSRTEIGPYQDRGLELPYVPYIPL